MKKHINITIIVLLILNTVLIYFSFFGFTKRTKTEELSTSKQVIESISIDYEAYGNPLSNVKIKNIEDTNANINNVASKVDSPFDISGNFSNFQLQQATVTINYDDKKLDKDVKEEDLLVLWYDEKNNKMVEMPTKVNAEKNKVTFKTNHFSQYVLVDKATWQAIWEREVAKIREEDAKFSIEFIIDDSGSMTSNDPERRRISAAKAAITSLSEDDQYLVMKFSDNSSVIQDFTNSTEDLNEVFEEFKSSGGTNISGAVDKGIDLLKNEDDDREKIIILLTDGEDSSLKGKIDDLVEKANKENIKIFGIGLQSKEDSNLNFDVPKDLAIRADGKFYKITETQLSDIFLELTNATVGVDGTKDYDEDGIPDEIEINGMRDQYGNTIKTNPYLADSDDDGKTDGEEMGRYVESEGYYKRASHPLVNETNPEKFINSYPVGPTKTGDDVHDSGFRPNINGFSFKNFDFEGDGGYCGGIAFFTEKVYNGKYVLKDGMYGELSADTFGTLIRSKRLYDYKMDIDQINLKLGPEDESHYDRVTKEDVKNDSDTELIIEIQENHKEANTLGKRAERNFASPKYVSEQKLKQIANIFDRKEIISIGLAKNPPVGKGANHLINGYALEKMSETEYRLYVYDSNFPYNPYYIKDAYDGNIYIKLTKVGPQMYSFDYTPWGYENTEGSHWRTSDIFAGMTIYYDGKSIEN